ncbi:hypothetical protein BV20DRAFT_984054 [Pilatotrama ljubarskyi]|nr:hypothetical protein BV20DRAFT_984054 [Pilatotrama ljubarskyi]
MSPSRPPANYTNTAPASTNHAHAHTSYVKSRLQALISTTIDDIDMEVSEQTSGTIRTISPQHVLSDVQRLTSTGLDSLSVLRALALKLSHPSLLEEHLHAIGRMSSLRTLAFHFKGPLHIGPLDAVFGNSEKIRTIHLAFDPHIRPDEHTIDILVLQSLARGFFPCMPSVLTVVLRMPGLHPSKLAAPAAYLWPTFDADELSCAVQTLLCHHSSPFCNSIQMGPMFRATLSKTRSLTTLALNYTGPPASEEFPDAFFADHITQACVGAPAGASIIPEMPGVTTLFIRLRDIRVSLRTVRDVLEALAPLLPVLHTVYLIDTITPHYVLDTDTSAAIRQVKRLFTRCDLYGPTRLTYVGWGSWLFENHRLTKKVRFCEWEQADRRDALESVGLYGLWTSSGGQSC